ncbi:DUF4352 domain-containing protein [Exiguobacterium sp. s193]|uniref:DUF4352 domain-containing protein n=1 Tax=Exiguobacterium sp. s193 TaxID=2751207 RepID=UPI001BE66A7A|nr:DUF4352 domain-containing protein [Exiguobacterium sp. s193]
MKKVIKWGAFLVIGFIILSALMNSEEPKTAEPETTVEGKEEKETTKPKAVAKPAVKKVIPKVGDQVKVGKLTYTVNDVKQVATLSNVLGEKKTSGQFLVVDVTILNRDKEERFVDSEMFKVKVGDTEYSADAELDSYANDGGLGFFLETINPNIEKQGKIVFELPKNANGYVLEVSSGFGWSGGESKQIKL